MSEFNYFNHIIIARTVLKAQYTVFFLNKYGIEVLITQKVETTKK